MTISRKQQLRDYCQKKGISMSGVIDKALNVYIGKNEWIPDAKPSDVLRTQDLPGVYASQLINRPDGPKTVSNTSTESTEDLIREPYEESA